MKRPAFEQLTYGDSAHCVEGNAAICCSNDCDADLHILRCTGNSPGKRERLRAGDLGQPHFAHSSPFDLNAQQHGVGSAEGWRCWTRSDSHDSPSGGNFLDSGALSCDIRDEKAPESTIFVYVTWARRTFADGGTSRQPALPGVHEFFVWFARFEELLVGPVRNDRTRVDHDDPVGPFGAVKSVCNDDRCATAQQRT